MSFNTIKSSRFNKLVKSPDPGPGTYNTEPILQKMYNKARGARFLKGKNIGYIDHQVKVKNFVPSVGAYINLEKALSTAYRPMRKSRR